LLLDGNGRRGRACQDDVGLQADQLLRQRSYRLVADTAEWLTAAPGTRHDDHLRSKVTHM
jgi:hypothetical protein